MPKTAIANPPIEKVMEIPCAKEAYKKLCGLLGDGDVAIGKPYLDWALSRIPLAPQGHHKPEKEAQKLEANLIAIAEKLSWCVHQLENNPACEDLRIKTHHFVFGGARFLPLMREVAGEIRKEAQRPKLLWQFDECHYETLRLLEQFKRKTGKQHYSDVSCLLIARMTAAGLPTEGEQKLWCSPDALKMLWRADMKNRHRWEAASTPQQK